MFAYIIGDIKLIKENFIVLENNNIGYKIFMASRNISSFVKNETVKIYTEYVVREDSAVLYGFINLDDLEMFLNLNNISGVGPKAALAILSTLSVYELKLAIVGNDMNTLIKSPGVGKKTASRIILELTDKIDIDKLTNDGSVNLPELNNDNNENYEVAQEALINLGYTKQEVNKVLQSINIIDLELSDIIKTALKRF